MMPKKKTDFDPDALLTELMDAVVKAYELEGGEHANLKLLAKKMGLSMVKVRKLLITAGERQNRPIYVYSTEKKKLMVETILTLYRENTPIADIAEATGLSPAAVYTYLPYANGAYNMRELSDVAERIRRCRARKAQCKGFSQRVAGLPRDEADAALWEILRSLQGCVFYTVKGRRFHYTLQDGEMSINLRHQSASLKKATVLLAFHNAMDIRRSEGVVSGPKDLGTLGASYLYPIFLRLGVCLQPPGLVTA